MKDDLTPKEVMDELVHRAETFDLSKATCFHAGMTREEIFQKFNLMVDTAKKACK